MRVQAERFEALKESVRERLVSQLDPTADPMVEFHNIFSAIDEDGSDEIRFDRLIAKQLYSNEL